MRNPFRRRNRGGPERRMLDTASVPSFAGDSEGSYFGVDGALRLAPVFAAGRLLASQVSSLPMGTFRETGDARQRIRTPAVFARPSRQGYFRDWVFRAVTSLAYWGNAVGLVVERDSLERVVRIEWLNPADVYVEESMTHGRGSFEDPVWSYMGIVIPTEDIVHIPWFVLPGRVWGLSPIGAYASMVEVGIRAQDYERDFLRDGGVPPGTFRNSAATVDQREADVMKARLTRSIRSRQPIVYGKDWEYTPITVSPDDARFVRDMRLTATQIAAIYGLPPEKIGGETGGSYTYSSPEQRQIELVQEVTPWLSTLESHFNELLPRGQYVKFNSDVLVRPDATTRFSNHRIARDIGLKSIDEIRVEEDMEPIPGELGNDYTPLSIKVREAGVTANGDDDAQEA